MVPHRQAAPHEQLFLTYAGFCFGGLPQRTHPALADKVSDMVNIGKSMKKYWKCKIMRKVIWRWWEKKIFCFVCHLLTEYIRLIFGEFLFHLFHPSWYAARQAASASLKGNRWIQMTWRPSPGRLPPWAAIPCTAHTSVCGLHNCRRGGRIIATEVNTE